MENNSSTVAASERREWIPSRQSYWFVLNQFHVIPSWFYLITEFPYKWDHSLLDGRNDDTSYLCASVYRKYIFAKMCVWIYILFISNIQENFIKRRFSLFKHSPSNKKSLKKFIELPEYLQPSNSSLGKSGQWWKIADLNRVFKIEWRKFGQGLLGEIFYNS